MRDLVIRFVLGAVVVSVFSAIGEAFEPKRFAGIFGAAPSVALPTLAMVFAVQGHESVAVEGRSMVIGGVAFVAYSLACIAMATRSSVPVWAGAVASWAAWAGFAFAGWKVLGLLSPGR